MLVGYYIPSSQVTAKDVGVIRLLFLVQHFIFDSCVVR